MTRYPLTLFFDGACPVCRLEMARLGERDALRRLVLVDVSAADFEVTRYNQAVGSAVTVADMQRLIHAQCPDGSWLIGVPALRAAYLAVGLGHWLAPTAWPLLQPLADSAYAAFARHRYGISRLLMPLLAGLEARRTLARAQACDAGLCTADPQTTAHASTGPHRPHTGSAS